ncbi:MAG: hypothetical protein JO043_05860, partial [Candidatus Eremiobacteraeota bacterium]|nr:hypothetical protein [Candidatus Eremiobacteraeota bacterium]
SALSSARFAAEAIVAALRGGDCSQRALLPYAERLHGEVGRDMLLARLVVRTVANRALNRMWLAMLRGVVARARIDRAYADATGGVIAGIVPTRAAFAPHVLLRTAFAIRDEFRQTKDWRSHVADGCVALAGIAQDRDGFVRWARSVAEAAHGVMTRQQPGIPSETESYRGGHDERNDTGRYALAPGA